MQWELSQGKTAVGALCVPSRDEFSTCTQDFQAYNSCPKSGVQLKPTPNHHITTGHVPRTHQSGDKESTAEMSVITTSMPPWLPFTSQHREQGPWQYTEIQKWGLMAMIH